MKAIQIITTLSSIIGALFCGYNLGKSATRPSDKYEVVLKMADSVRHSLDNNTIHFYKHAMNYFKTDDPKYKDSAMIQSALEQENLKRYKSIINLIPTE